jgi:Uncharacterised nucleotidyltransferase
MTVELGEFSLERMVRAVEKVRERLLRAAAALNAAGIPYAVAGGNAVALWVSRVDEAAVRNTRDVDILIRRGDLDAVKEALGKAGFVHRHSSGIEIFLDGPDSKARDAVHVVFANEMVRQGEFAPNPDVSDSENAGEYQVLSLSALVLIKLTAFRRKDQVHLLDLIDVGLIDESWTDKLPEPLAARLRLLIENPDG